MSLCVCVCVCVCICVSVVPTMLVANKADLEIGREVTTEEGQRLAKELRLVCVCVCVCVFTQLNAELNCVCCE